MFFAVFDFPDEVKSKILIKINGVLEFFSSFYDFFTSFLSLISCQVDKEEIELTEGDDEETLTITSNLPPRLFCDQSSSNTSCTWTIKTIFKEPNKPVTCADGRRSYQALVKWSGDGQDTPFCGTRITDENWQTGTEVMLAPGMDGLKDGKQELTLQIMASFQSNTYTVVDLPVSYFIII